MSKQQIFFAHFAFVRNAHFHSTRGKKGDKNGTFLRSFSSMCALAKLKIGFSAPNTYASRLHREHFSTTSLLPFATQTIVGNDVRMRTRIDKDL